MKERIGALTLVSTESYTEPACVLGFTLREQGWPHATEVLVTADIGQSYRRVLSRWWDTITEIEPIQSRLSGDLCWSPTVANYTKLRLWTKTEYRRLIYLDADTIVLGSLADVIERPRFAAAPCLWPPDAFNTGVLVLEPSDETFADMMAKSGILKSYDASDQGFLNSYFSDWYDGPGDHRLPTKFNTSQFLYLYHASWRAVMEDIRVLHFTGPHKPWRTRSPFWRRVHLNIQKSLVKSAGGGPDPHALWWLARERMGAAERAGESMVGT